MKEDNSLSSILQQDAQTLKESGNHLLDMNKRITRKILIYRYRRSLVLALVLIALGLMLYPVIKPLLNAALFSGNMFAAGVLGLFAVLVLAVFISEQVESD